MHLAGEDPVGGLLEREHDLQRLGAAVRAAVDGAGAIFVLEGEAGIGKTALLGQACAIAHDAGMRVLTARGGELERGFAFGVVRQLFEGPIAAADGQDRERWLAGAAALADPVVSARAPTRPVEGDAGPVLHGLYWLSANLAAEQPLLIAIDDAHWADDASIAFLTYLARRVDELAVLLVYAARPQEAASGTLPANTDHGLAASVLRPRALSEQGTLRLVTGLLGDGVSQRFADACHATTGGNPFLLRELLRVLEADAIAPLDANAEQVARTAPRAIAHATLARLARLGAPAGRLAVAVAVLGRSAALRDAAALAELSGDEAAEAADALAGAAILRDVRPLEFIHPIVQTTVYGALAPGRRAACHKRAARLLWQGGAPAVALAPHLLATEPAGDEWVVVRLRAAAHDVLTRGAPDAAVTYLERALAEPPPPAERPAVLLELGSAELHVARPAAIAHLRDAADAACDQQLRFRATQELAWALMFGDRAQEAVEVGTRLLSTVPAEEAELRLQLEGWLAAFSVFAPTLASTALDRFADSHDSMRAETIGERQALAVRAFAAAHRGAPASAAVQLARRALADGHLLFEQRPGGGAPTLAIWALIYAERLDEAERWFDRASADARERGWQTGFAVASACRCQVLIRQGRIREAEAEAVSTLGAGAPHAIGRAILLATLLHTMRERVDQARWQPFLITHGLDGELWETVMAGMLLLERGHLRLAARDAAGALADFEQLRRRDELSGLDTPAVPSRASAALARWALGEPEAARALAAEELERARHWGTPGALAFALRVAGLLEQGPAGIELLRQSVAAAEESPARYEHALSLTELGAALRRAGQRRDARPPLRDALDLAHRCGALALARRARDELVATGARPRRDALRGRDALTASELRIARLAADGLANREIAQALFVTVRTVETHLRSAYQKLDISSRAELAAALGADRDGALG